jgi:hypothetical protein
VICRSFKGDTEVESETIIKQIVHAIWEVFAAFEGDVKANEVALELMTRWSCGGTLTHPH